MKRTCICEFHSALLSATELRLSRLLIVGESPPSNPGSPGSPEVVRKAVVFVFNSDIRFLSDRISPLSFSASLLILMNCVRFCMRFCWRSAAARAFSFPSDSSNSRMPSSSTSARAAATSKRGPCQQGPEVHRRRWQAQTLVGAEIRVAQCLHIDRRGPAATPGRWRPTGGVPIPVTAAL